MCSSDLLVLSDHGFTSFQRGLNLNSWLWREGYLALQEGVEPGDATQDLFHGVDWSRTRAFALGLGAVYLNKVGREPQGIVSESQEREILESIAGRLSGLIDPDRNLRAVRRVVLGKEVYSGPYTA